MKKILGGELMAVVIRNMKLADIDAVKEIAIKSWHHTYDGIIPIEVQDKFLSMAYSRDTLKKRLETSPFYVAEENGQVVGFANFSNLKDDGEVELAAIYLLPKSQRRGIGSKLLEQGIKEISPKKVFVSVDSGNVKGKEFYKAKNFETVDNIEEYFFGHKLKTTRMVLKIE